MPTIRFVIGLIAAIQIAHGTSVVNVADFGAVAGSGVDATPAFQLAIAAAADAPKPVTLLVPPGRYDFDPAAAHRRACYFSNATESGSDAVRTIALDFTDISDLTVSATGATLMMRGKMTMLVAERCRGFSMRGATFDFARPCVSEVTAVEKGADYWIAKVNSDCTFQIQGNAVLWTGENWSARHDMVQHYDPIQDITWRGGDPMAGATSIQDLGDGRLRFAVPAGTLGNVVVGRIYQFRNTVRDQVGMWFNRCADVSLEDVTVRAVHGGLGLLCQFTENVTFDRVNMTPDPAGSRTCVSPSDFYHFSGCKGVVRMRDSVLKGAHDDALNVHGTHLRIVGVPNSNRIRVRFMHHQTWGFQAFVPGDEIEFIRRTTMLPYASSTVGAVEMVSPTDQILTLNGPNPSGIVIDSDAVENVTWTPSVEMINCDIDRIPTRGILLTTRRPILIQGNRFFRTQMSAILCEDDASGWYESGPNHDLTIRGNAFYECAGGVISLNPQNSVHAGPVHRNIRVVENAFTLTGTPLLYARSCDSVHLDGNLVRMTNNTSPAFGSLVSTTNTTNLTYGSNSVSTLSTPALVVSNGGFENAASGGTSGPGRIPHWYSLPDATVRGDAVAGHRLELPSGGVVFQELGWHDFHDGMYFAYSFQQTGSDGGCAGLILSLHTWDGRFSPSDDVDILGSLPPIRERRLAPVVGKSGTIRTGGFDLTGIPAGARLWLRIAAENGTDIDDVEFRAATAPDVSRYSGWVSMCGLVGADADPAADPDRDHLPNLIEYLLEGADPLQQGDSALGMPVGLTPNRPEFVYVARTASDAALSLEYQIGGLDTPGWKTVVDGVDGISVTAEEGGVRRIRMMDPMAPSCFFRLRAGFNQVAPPWVGNAGFEIEDRTGLEPAYTTGAPAGWTFVTGVNAGVEEIRDSRFGPIGPEGSRLVALGGDGDQVGYINLGSAGGSTATATSASAGLVEPNKTYTLAIAFAQRGNGAAYHPDTAFGLLAGDAPVGTFTTFTGPSLPTGFTQKTFVWTSPGPESPLVGQPLRIQMNFTYSSASGGWQQAQFDKIRLGTGR